WWLTTRPGAGASTAHARDAGAAVVTPARADASTRAPASTADAGTANFASRELDAAAVAPLQPASTKHHPIARRPSRRSRRRAHRRRRAVASKAPPPAIAKTRVVRVEVPAAAKPRVPDIAAARARLAKAVTRARQRGLYAGDLASFDRAVAAARRALRAADAVAADKTSKDVAARADAFHPDRAFVERKLGRLQRALERAAPDKQRAHRAASQNALRLVLAGQYAAASTRISRALSSLRGR
ncbi:MAG: hypothetical protein KC503_12190, partial [Myxococcales bacterium]|nr:hypothetical protein [Myxococcales bacterium]